MGIKLAWQTSVCVAVCLFFITSCSPGGDSSSTDTDGQFTKVDELVMPNSTSQTYTVNVPEGATSLTIIADGGDAADMDISKITDPTGYIMVSRNFWSDPIGKNTTQAYGQSAVAFTLPHSDSYSFTAGTWSFEITNAFTFSNTGDKTVSVYTNVKSGLGDTINVNIWLVAIDDYQGSGDPNFNNLLGQFERALGNTGIRLGAVNIIELNGAQAEKLTYPDMDTDGNNNEQADDMDEIFRLSSSAGNDYINFFLVKNLGTGTIGIAGGLPGPMGIQGTAHSGVLVSLLGGFTQMSTADIKMQGDTMAHEMGHYLGLFHTTEESGHAFDPISDTPECPASSYDRNRDGSVTSSECSSVDGSNLMFWSAASYPQETVSAVQSRILRSTPAVQ